MKKFLMVVAALASLGTVALAGPNAGGTIFATDANLVYTTDITNYCGLGTIPATCDGADLQVNPGGQNVVWKVFAAFPQNSSPRLKAVAFGVSYDAGNILVNAFGPCPEFELAGAGWPAPNTGTSVVWTNVQTGLLTEAYWFAGYNYYGAGTFNLIGNPDQGGNFADDSVPSILDPIAAYGSLGFDMAGTPGCPGTPPPTGACCFPDGTCAVLTAEDCSAQGGAFYGGVCDPNPCPPPPTGACCVGTVCTITFQADCQGTWQGPDTLCDPNPCQEPNPVETTTWGQIKNNYR